MAEEKELTKIERELVLQYLRDDNVPLTVTLEEKPEQQEASLENSMVYTPEELKVSASAVFPVAVPGRQIEVLNQGIILLKSSAKSVQLFAGKTVRVQFYFNHLGLYFITTMKECSQGLALVVPSSIKRVKDDDRKSDFDFKAEVSFKDGKNSTVVIQAFSPENRSVFVQPKWSDIPLENQVKAKSLLEAFVKESQNSAVSAGNGLQLLSIVRYLTQRAGTESELQNVEVRAKPLDVIYIDNKRMVLASRQKENPIAEEGDYSLKLIFTLNSSSAIKRVINVDSYVEKLYEDEGDESKGKCWSCCFKSLKEEDNRFLYEKIYGRLT